MTRDPVRCCLNSHVATTSFIPHASQVDLQSCKMAMTEMGSFPENVLSVNCDAYYLPCGGVRVVSCRRTWMIVGWSGMYGRQPSFKKGLSHL